jgi:hypothetical protein
MSLRGMLPPEILLRASALPISHAATLGNIGLQNLCWYLPTLEVAHKLRTVYYTHAAWMWVLRSLCPDLISPRASHG